MDILKGLLRKLIVFIIVLLIIMPLISPDTFGESKITAEGGDKVKAGETFIVKVTYGGEDIGRVDGQLTYDTSKLEYIKGGSSEGDTGYVQLKLAGTDGTITFTLQFRALEAGSTDLEITTNEIYDFAEMPLDNPSLTKTVSISDGGGSDVEEDATEGLMAPPEEGSLDSELTNELEDDDNSADINMILMISAVVLLLIIIVIVFILKRRR